MQELHITFIPVVNPSYPQDSFVLGVHSDGKHPARIALSNAVKELVRGSGEATVWDFSMWDRIPEEKLKAHRIEKMWKLEVDCVQIDDNMINDWKTVSQASEMSLVKEP